MTKYIFAIDPTKDEFSGTDYSIVISTKAYFDAEGYLQDSYSDQEIDEINAVMDKYGASELMESTYECGSYNAKTIKTLLDSEELFAYSSDLQAFVDTWGDESE